MALRLVCCTRDELQGVHCGVVEWMSITANVRAIMVFLLGTGIKPPELLESEESLSTAQLEQLNIKALEAGEKLVIRVMQLAVCDNWIPVLARL